MIGNDAEATATSGARAGRAGRAHRWPGLRSPRPSAPPRDLVEAIGLALSLTDHEAPAGSPVPPGEALRRLRAARDEVVGLVSHELRTPVTTTTIYGNARLLLDRQRGVGPELRPMLVDIVQNAERLLAIVENLLLLARSESGTPRTGSRSSWPTPGQGAARRS